MATLREPVRFVIPLDPRTKKNHQMIAGNGPKCAKCGKPAKQYIRQGKAHDEYAEAAKWFLRPAPPEPIQEPVNVKCIFYMETRRKVDSLNLLAAVDDLLVDAKILSDDNSRVVVAHDGSRVRYDRHNPRTEVEITPMPEEPYQLGMEIKTEEDW